MDFAVKPILEGTFPLTLKVAVLEQIDGKERKREIVLEKEIFIVAANKKQINREARLHPLRPLARCQQNHLKLTLMRAIQVLLRAVMPQK
ncbi:MAG: hypothetical protein HC817_10095 [Saprospiraceae bacterium]|nr:hypothetical protein [Saprospiraceae bacterium]